MKKNVFYKQPEFMIKEGSGVLLNFGVEEGSVQAADMEPVENADGDTWQQNVFFGWSVRVKHPLTFDRTKEALLEQGFSETEAEEQTALILLRMIQEEGMPVGNAVELAKRAMTARISAYDKSDSVNSFTFAGVQMWLDKDTRNGLINRLNAEMAVGKETSTLWLGTQSFTISPADGLQMLSALEVYASECYDKTAEHKAVVAAMDNVEEILAYDYTAGYPDNPVFGV